MDQLLITAEVFIIGAVMGVFMKKTTDYLISQRVKTLTNHQLSGSVTDTIFWAMLNAIIWLVFVKLNGLEPKTLECMLLFSICVILSAVDISIKKIPNELVLMTIFVGGAFIITGQPITSIGMNIFGLVIGFIIFFLPAIIGKGAGWGDVKYAAAVGFCLGVYGIISAIMIMTFFLMIYTAYLIIRRKGNLKSKVALGPFMASSFVSVLILNLINTNYLMEFGMLF
ncbi:prepilin peptidase [Acetobacterium wieringae]|uniref:Type IV leader peptidase family protein n=1 Tax=Acetobacterium wieringae TaxID=52694 RepID=A0A1F2PE47_9FIRM|nr:A24 family peptidase [Acetobacterium wieringae]OFV69508.1 type IV leader peptidase family protein [Acetobacterium wieringae]